MTRNNFSMMFSIINGISVGAFHIDGADGFKDNSKNLFDVDIPANDPRLAQLWFWTETQSVRDRRVEMITVVDIIPDLRPERPSGSAADLASNETHKIVHSFWF
jgi:hypothetical protein